MNRERYLQSIEDPQDLLEAPADGGGIKDNGLNLLLGVEEEDGAAGQGQPLGVSLPRVHDAQLGG